jgi:hypothetical protein
VRLDIRVSAEALRMAYATGSGAAADERSDLLDPDLDGSHIIAHCFGYGYDLTLGQLLAQFAPVAVAEFVNRGLVVVNAAGRAGVTVGWGYVIEPAGGVYALTSPEPERWVAAYQPPRLVRSSVVVDA